MIGELESLVILSSFPHLGSVRIRQLIQRFGSGLATLNANPEEIAGMADFGPKIAQSWKSWEKDSTWRINLELAKRSETNIISYTDPKYPKYLLEIHDHPVLLYIQGEFIPEDNRGIAVVGTRRASIYGMEMAEKISLDLAAAGYTIVSGLARGVDTAAHAGALRRGRTVAVIGSGLADIYPQENIPLARSIAEKGCLISEFPMATPPDRQNFPQRNRIVSGMSLATVLIEAPIKSGAMITVEKAISQKKRVFALPGRVDSADFQGNHGLIKSGKANLIEGAQDIIECFENLFGLINVEPKTQFPRQSLLTDEESKFMNLLPQHELTIDEIIQQTKIPVAKINVLVTGLVLKKILKEFPGKIFKKCAI